MRQPYLLHNRQNLRQSRALARMPSVELVITCGRARKRVRKVAGPVFLIGSSMDCDLILGDPLMPAVHSYVLITAYGVRLRHLGELPAIRVNGQTWEVTQLEDQDRIDIGSFAFLVRLAWPVEGRDLLPLATAEPASGYPEPCAAGQRFDAHQEAAQIRRRHI